MVAERTHSVPLHLPDQSAFAGLGTVADLSAPVRTVPATLPAAQLDEMFRLDDGLRWVAAVGDRAPVLVERAGFAMLMAGCCTDDASWPTCRTRRPSWWPTRPPSRWQQRR